VNATYFLHTYGEYEGGEEVIKKKIEEERVEEEETWKSNP
jgi:hypothetical protein